MTGQLADNLPLIILKEQKICKLLLVITNDQHYNIHV